MPQGLLIGLDIGGTKLLVASATPDGVILRTERADSPHDARQGLDVLDRMVATVAAGEPIAGIGAVAGGPMNFRTGDISPLNQPGWADVPLGRHLADRFGRPWRIEVDTDGAVLAEHRFGGGPADRLLYLTFSTGVGGGLLIGGEIYRGADGIHPEYGHQSIPFVVRRPEAIQCACGTRDCLEAICSGRGIERIYGKPATQLDPGEWDEVADNIGLGLRNLAAAHAPREFVLGGGVAIGGGQRLVDRAAAMLRSRLRIGPVPPVRLSSLGYHTALLGAVALAQDAAAGKTPDTLA